MFKDESIFLEFPSLLENWKGLGKNKRKTKKPRSMQVRKIPLLLNGSRSRSGVENVLLTNTCAFDAVSQTIAAGCIDGFDLNTSVLNSDDMFCQFITASIDKKNIKQDLYKLRVEMLERFFEKKQLYNLTTIHCECSVTYIFERILIDVIHSADVLEK